MQKIRSIKMDGFLNLIKCALIGIITTLIGTVIFAVVLKFANLSSNFIGYINNIIKVFSIFIMVMCLRRKSSEKLMFKSIFVGLIYAILSLVLFSILNGQFNMNISFLYDLLFVVIVSIVATIIINLINHKSV